MYAAKRIPKDANAWRFWKLLVLHAEQTGSRTLFQRAVKEFTRLRQGRLTATEKEWLERLRRRFRRSL
jgi:hypothetical protein